MNQHDNGTEIVALRERLAGLTQASLRINQTLDLDTVLQEVLDCARALTGAFYGIIALVDSQHGLLNILFSGMSDEEVRQIFGMPQGERLFRHLSELQKPLRVDDFQDYLRSQGISEFSLPMPVNSAMPYLAAPIIHRDQYVGSIYLSDKESGSTFTQEDEDTLMMFASQAALVIANAQRYQEEQRTRADLEALIDTSPVGVLVFDAVDGRIVSQNREVSRIAAALGMPDGPSEDTMTALTIRRGDGSEVSLKDIPFAQALSSGETVRLEQMVFRTPGHSLTVMVNATPIRSDDGVMRSFVVTLQDMTPIEDMERQRTEFLGMVSHELRLPLTSIKGSVETLIQLSPDLDPVEVQQFYHIIRDQSDRMRDMIGDLLDAARIDSGTLSVHPEPTQVVTMVDEAKRRYLSGAGRQNLQIKLPPDLPTVMADRRRITQVLTNLLVNATRFSREGSAIQVSAEAQDFHVAVSVTDHGAGVSAERAPHLFNKFFRADDANTGRDHGNTGLGLAICKGIIEAHGGRIWVESAGLDQGSRFTFTVPIAEPGYFAGVDTSGKSRIGAPTEQPEVSILVVDDDPQTLRYVREALSGTGYSVTVAGDAAEAFRLAEAHPPDLAILDLVLPDGDGINLMQTMKAVWDLPVIFLSVYGQDRVIAEAFEAGAADYVVKPFSPTELVARIRAELRRAGISPTSTSGTVVLGDLVIDYDQREVRQAGRVVDLTATEYELIRELSAAQGRPVSHEQLLRRIWRRSDSSDARVVRTNIGRLRGKLGDNGENPTYILTEPGIGYRMAGPGTHQPAGR